MSQVQPFSTSRTFDAPREAVFAEWSRETSVRRWFTPLPLGTGECRLDFRPGGEWIHAMVMPDGRAHTMRARYTEILPNERLAFEAAVEEMAASRIRTMVTFEAEGARTRLQVRQSFAGEVRLEDALQGWKLTLDQLEAVVAGG
jgi:uncharacterized protein YndB with AHSA1/START domain